MAESDDEFDELTLEVTQEVLFDVIGGAKCECITINDSSVTLNFANCEEAKIARDVLILLKLHHCASRQITD